MASDVLKKITAAAKRMRKANPRITWKSAVKKAGIEYRSTKAVKKKKRVGATLLLEKRETKRTPIKRVVRVRRTTDGRYVSGIGPTTSMFGSTGALSISGIRSAGKKMLLDEIGKLEAKKFICKLKRDKTKIAKKIAEKKAMYRKLS